MLVAFVISSGGCVVYEPMPVSSQPTLQQRFDRSWAAAMGAMTDQGLSITAQDRGAGVIRGVQGSVTITATLTTLPDGRIQVKFDSTTSGTDSAVIQRVSESYERRMGR
jgi:hypothetical protein